MYVATRTHYSVLGTTGESQSSYGSAGWYKVARDSIIFHIVVANPAKRAGGVEHFHVRAKGDSLWLTGTTDDFYELRDGRLVPMTPGFRAIEILLVRLPR
jgi:hypothetical protein